MTSGIWELPGAAGFMEETLGALREGANLVLHLPEYAPSGCGAAVRRAVRQEDIVAFRQVELDTGHELPGNAVAAAMDLDSDDPCFRSPEALAQGKRLAGSVVCVSGVSGQGWPAWRTFLERFARATKACVAGECGQLCVLAHGEISVNGLDTDPGLRRIAWRERVTPLDVRIQLGRTWNGSGRSTVERDLRIALASELAGFDLQLASKLLAEPLARLLSPRALLAAEAVSRNWSGSISRDGWASGRADKFEGRIFEHPASLAASGNVDEIDRRVWRAELAVVFPWIEERRIEIVRKLRNVLTPTDSHFGYVERIEDLELAHVLRQVRQKRRGTEWEPKLDAMNKLRRALAHLEPVNPYDLAGAGIVDPALLAS